MRMLIGNSAVFVSQPRIPCSVVQHRVLYVACVKTRGCTLSHEDYQPLSTRLRLHACRPAPMKKALSVLVPKGTVHALTFIASASQKYRRWTRVAVLLFSSEHRYDTDTVPGDSCCPELSIQGTLLSFDIISHTYCTSTTLHPDMRQRRGDSFSSDNVAVTPPRQSRLQAKLAARPNGGNVWAHDAATM